MSKIVVLTPSLPLPFGTADARWLCALLPELAHRGHDVVCLSCTEEALDTVALAEANCSAKGIAFRHVPFDLSESVVRRKARSMLHPHSEFSRCSALSLALEQERAVGWDVLHVEHIYTSWATQDMPRAVTYLHYLSDVDWADRAGLGWRDRIEKVQLGRASRQLLGSDQIVIAMTDRLAREVVLHGGPLAPVVPMALDISQYALQPFVEEPVLGVIGSMHWYPSRAAAERVIRLWPEIHARVPEARLKVAGWASEQYLGKRFPLEGAELVGTVENPEAFFGQVALLAYPPPRGTGMKVKVMEAFAYGVAVLSNGEGLEGLAIEDGRHAVRAESDAEIVEQASSLLVDIDRRRAMRAAARLMMERELTVAHSIDCLLAAYEHLGLVF